MKKLILIASLLINIVVYSQENKTVTLVVSGQGTTQEEAKQIALRSAIEQAFGTFISSKTEILNDELIKDEIVSVANGNIQKFEVISEIQIPDGGYATTLKATVSVTKLTSFCESKGFEVEFKGSLFGANIKQQKLNEESELKAIINLCEISNSILSKSLDFSLEVGEPQVNKISRYSDESKYLVLLNVNIRSNSNYDVFKEYFLSTISSIAMSEEEKDNYQSLNKKIYHLDILDEINSKKLLKAIKKNDRQVIEANKIEIKRVRGKNGWDRIYKQRTEFYFRNPKTTIALQNFFLKSNRFTHSFKITSNKDSIFFNKKNTCTDDYDRRDDTWLINDDSRPMRNGSIPPSVYSFPSFNWNAYNSHKPSDHVDLFKIYLTYYIVVDHDLLFDKNNYFTNTNSEYLRQFKGPRKFDRNVPPLFGVMPLGEFLPGYDPRFDNALPIIRDAIGTLDLQKTINNSMTYSATYTLEEITELTEFKIEQLK